MTSCFHCVPISLTRSYLKTTYRTRTSGVIISSTFGAINNKSYRFREYSNMPVVTALAVVAHRQTHHATMMSSECSNVLCSHYRRLSCSSAVHVSSLNPLVRRKYNVDVATGNGKPLLPLYDYARRGYAKGKDKPKTKKSAVAINEEEMNEVINVESFKKNLEKQLEQMKEEFSKQLSIRGSAGALETLEVEFDGETFPLQELAQIGRKNPQLAVLNMSSLPDAIQPVIKAIRESGMNLNPQQEGTTIYIPLPKVTREHRENLSKNAKALFNKFKTNLQSIQNKYVKECKSNKEISEDLSFRVQQQIMKLTENYIVEAEKLLTSKQSELLENK